MPNDMSMLPQGKVSSFLGEDKMRSASQVQQGDRCGVCRRATRPEEGVEWKADVSIHRVVMFQPSPVSVISGY